MECKGTPPAEECKVTVPRGILPDDDPRTGNLVWYDARNKQIQTLEHYNWEKNPDKKKVEKTIAFSGFGGLVVTAVVGIGVHANMQAGKLRTGLIIVLIIICVLAVLVIIVGVVMFMVPSEPQKYEPMPAANRITSTLI